MPSYALISVNSFIENVMMNLDLQFSIVSVNIFSLCLPFTISIPSDLHLSTRHSNNSQREVYQNNIIFTNKCK